MFLCSKQLKSRNTSTGTCHLMYFYKADIFLLLWDCVYVNIYTKLAHYIVLDNFARKLMKKNKKKSSLLCFQIPQYHKYYSKLG